MTVDLPLARPLLKQILRQPVDFMDSLSLDPEMFKYLTYLTSYEGLREDLDLTFTICDVVGDSEVEVIELLSLPDRFALVKTQHERRHNWQSLYEWHAHHDQDLGFAT